jgi:hypothetical protein
MRNAMSAHPRAPLRHDASRMEDWLPHAVIATACVVILPAIAVWELLPQSSGWRLLSMPVAMALSVSVAGLGSAVWKRWPCSRDLVFAELMLWGWLRRHRAEQRIGDAHDLLGKNQTSLPVEDRVEALVRLSGLLEARDAYTHGHSHRVARHAERIAVAMGRSSAEVAKVRTAAAMHDVGKIDTPRTILNKPGRLTDAEFDVVKRHSVDGALMVASIGDDDVTAMVRHHHERLDGRGYPDGLAGEAIPLGARIIAVADTFDAITSSRSYRGARSHKLALDILRKESGAQLDAGAVNAFLGYYSARRSVAWSALATSVAQRFLIGLSGATHGLSGGAAVGAAALLSGLGSAAGPVSSAPARAEPVGASVTGPSVAVAASPVGAGFAPTGERRSKADSRPPKPRGRRSPRPPERRISEPSQPTAPRSNALRAQPAPAAHSQDSPPSFDRGRDPLQTIRVPRVDVPPEVSPVQVPLPSVDVPDVEVPQVALPVLDVELPKFAPADVEVLLVNIP